MGLVHVTHQTLRRNLVLALAATLAPAPPSHADFLYFRRGGAVQLPCRRAGSKIIVQAPDGPVEFAADDFRRIVPGGDPPAEWPERWASAKSRGSDATFAEAWWALENGLTPEASRALRDLHAADPRHEPTAGLVRLLDAIAPPLPDPDLSGLTSALAGTFRIERSDHFVLLHQGNETEAKARTAVLENVYATFYLTFAGQGIILPPPRERLPAAVFARQADYLAFLNREGAEAFASAQGYFHPTRQAVVSFDPRDHPTFRRRAEQIRPGRDAARSTLLLDLDRRAIDLGLAAHEAAHQLVAASRLAPRHDAFPMWLHEGLAAQFEVVRGGRWAGVGRANDLRLPDWRALLPPPRLAPLVRDEGFGRGYRRDLYAESWALVYFLRKSRPADFGRFLDLVRSPAHEAFTFGRTFDSFRTCFGDDLLSLEIGWHHYLRSVSTPPETADSPQIRAARD